MWTQTKKIASYTRFLRERALIYKRTKTERSDASTFPTNDHHETSHTPKWTQSKYSKCNITENYFLIFSFLILNFHFRDQI